MERNDKFVTNISTQYHFMNAYEPFYISFLVVCMIIALQIYLRAQANIDRESVTRAFKAIIRVYILYIVTDFLWVILSCHTDYLTLVVVLEYIESGILALFTFCWFRFAEFYIEGFLVKNIRTEAWYSIPYLVTVVVTTLYILNITGILGKPRVSDALYVINSMVDSFYLIFAFMHTLYKMTRERYKIRRQRYWVILECIVFPAVGAGISFFISYVPYIILGILPSIIKILIEMQNANIYTDALTRINNRYRVDEYLEHNWEHCSPERPLWIYIIDINQFKKINDRFGHTEGDRALVAIADALKKMAYEGLVIGRFGGDEFILVDSQNHDPKSVTRELRSYLKEIASERQFAFALTVSVGYASCTDPSEQITEVKKRADVVLYQDKKAQKAALRA